MGEEEMLSLAERCERATGPDDMLDRDIKIACEGLRDTPEGYRWKLFPDEVVDRQQFPLLYPDGTPTNRQMMSSPAYTSSLDAAMTLVPEVLEWETGSVGWARLRPADTLDQLDPRVVLVRKAATPALALCAASLRARASSEQIR